MGLREQEVLDVLQIIKDNKYLSYYENSED
mgnify:CR=1 FL=1